jgi:hypothetical protein
MLSKCDPRSHIADAAFDTGQRAIGLSPNQFSARQPMDAINHPIELG